MEKISGLLFDLIVETANSESLQPIKKLTAQAKNEGLPFFRYGFKANIGRSYHSYSNEYFNGKRKFSYEVGLMTQLKITKNISLQPEVLYSSLASEYSTGNFRTHSITTPISLVLATKMNRTLNNRAFVHFGGYFSHHFSGSANGESLDFNNTFDQSETGIIYGLGMEMSSVFIGINAKCGLSNIMKDSNTNEFKNRATYISIGYMF
jgi:hypothetical protein